MAGLPWNGDGALRPTAGSQVWHDSSGNGQRGNEIARHGAGSPAEAAEPQGPETVAI